MSRRPGDWIHAYTRDISSDDFRRLFTHDTRDAYDFFTRGQREDAFGALPWWKRLPLRFRQFMVAFTMRLPPARRALYVSALVVALLGVIKLFRGVAAVDIPFGTPFFQVGIPLPVWERGTFVLVLGFLLVNLLVVLEVADRLSLKGELEVAREIQLAMLPRGTYAAADIEIFGTTRPANTVGGDFYDVLPLPDGQVIVALGDVAGKGSPAALLMALLLAVLRTLVDERLEPAPLVERLNVQIARHSPASRFITLFYAVYTPSTGRPGLRERRPEPAAGAPASTAPTSACASTGVALGMFEGSTFGAERTTLQPGELLVLYSDGITEAENPSGSHSRRPGSSRSSMRTLRSAGSAGAQILTAVERHADRSKFLDDLTILLVKRAAAA